MENKNIKLSIIVPIYNVEKYVYECVSSLYKQNLAEEEFEVILVNDGTKDNSMEVLIPIIKQHNNIAVINQENQGPSIARNNAMKIASGEYIAYVDSDDVIVHNSIKLLLDQAKSHHPDLIVGEYLKLDDEAILHYQDTHTQQAEYSYTVKSGHDLLREDLNPRECYVWRTLYRRAFLEEKDIRFIPGIYYEDTPFLNECYLKAGVCVKTNIPFYIYRIGHESITKGITKRKATDYAFAIAKTWELTKIEGLPANVKARLQDNVYAAFSVLIYAITKEMEDSAERIQVVKYLKQEAPDLSFSHGFGQCAITFLYKNCPRTYLYMKHFYQKHIK